MVRPLLLAASIAAFGASAALAQQAGAENSCMQVKNPAARDLCSQARTQFSSGSYRVALVNMKKALEASPKEGILRANLARILMRFSDNVGAERELRQARKDGAPDHAVLPVLFRAMVNRHEELILLNEFPEPAAGAKGMVTSDILQGRAMALFSLDRADEAAHAMDRSLSLNRDTDGLLLRSEIATRQKDGALARKLVDEAYKLDPKNGPVMFARLQQLVESNDDAATLAMADQMLKLFPYNSDARVGRIKVYLKQNQDAKAKQEVNALLARSGRLGVGLYYKAVLLQRAHDRKGAAQVIQSLPPEFVKTHPEYAVEMAQMALDNGNVETASAVLGAGLSAAPDMVEARLRLASLRMTQNSPQAALTVLSPVQDSKDPRVQKLLGEVRARIAKDRAF
jgi:predicted Zn-dependent protease